MSTSVRFHTTMYILLFTIMCLFKYLSSLNVFTFVFFVHYNMSTFFYFCPPNVYIRRRRHILFYICFMYFGLFFSCHLYDIYFSPFIFINTCRCVLYRYMTICLRLSKFLKSYKFDLNL